MGNFFAKSTVKDIVNDPEIMEPLASSVKKVVTDPEVISSAKEIITDPKITTVVDNFRRDIVAEMELGRVQVVDQLKLARGEVVDKMEVAIDQVKLARGEVGDKMQVAIDQFKLAQGQVIDQMKFARRDAAIYFGVGSVLALGVVVGVAIAYCKFRSTPPPPPASRVVLFPPVGDLEGTPDDGLRTILFRIDPRILREVRFGAEV